MRSMLMLALSTVAPGCQADANTEHLPAFLRQLIEEYEAASEQRYPFEIWRYEYEGESVFYVPLARALCCDIQSVLYSVDGEILCRPDGGFTGRGDGRCPDFDPRASEGVRVWGEQR